MLDNQDPAVSEIRRHTQSILDGCRSVPVSFHEDHWNETNDFISKFVTHVLAWPDAGSRQVDVEFPLAQPCSCRVVSQQVSTPWSYTEARVDKWADDGFFGLPRLPESECGTRPFIIMSIIKRKNEGRIGATFFLVQSSLEVSLAQGDRDRVPSFFILN